MIKRLVIFMLSKHKLISSLLRLMFSTDLVYDASIMIMEKCNIANVGIISTKHENSVRGHQN
jgi:hypothetical protein